MVDRALGEYEVDTVFHLAAQTIVPTANKAPAATFDANIRGTWTVLEAVRAHAVARTVVASSDKAYGPHDSLPYREDFALQARFPYDASKAAADIVARSYFHTYGIPVAVTRFANIYGPGDLNVSRLIPEVVTAVLAGRRPVIRSDGTPERDFLYVDDAASAYLAIADALDGAGAPARRSTRAGANRSPWARSSPWCADSLVPTSNPTSGAAVHRPARSTVNTSTPPRSERSAAGSRRSGSRRA